MNSSTNLRASLVACSVALIAACGAPPAEETPNPLIPDAAEDYVFPVDLAGDYTIRWTAADGIDLTSPEATIVRAVSEAMTLSGLVGEELSYPGWFEFWETYNRRPDTVADIYASSLGSPGMTRHLGTRDRYLYRLERSDQGILVEYCSDNSYLVSTQDNGQTIKWYRGPTVPALSSSFMITRSTENSNDLSQYEPSGLRAPNWNVFEGWDAVRLFGLPTDYQLCTDWYQNRQRDTDMPEWVNTTGTPPTGLPPVKPPHPGW